MFLYSLSLHFCFQLNSRSEKEWPPSAYVTVHPHPTVEKITTPIVPSNQKPVWVQLIYLGTLIPRRSPPSRFWQLIVCKTKWMAGYISSCELHQCLTKVDLYTCHLYARDNVVSYLAPPQILGLTSKYQLLWPTKL